MTFLPKDEIAQWRKVERVLQVTTVGDTITYQQLGDTLGMHPDHERRYIQAAARKAARHFLEQSDRAVETVPRVGYRVVPAIRQIPLAGKQVERATRTLDYGHALTTHVRLEELSAQERTIFQTMALGFAQVAEWARQIGRRVDDHEGRLSDIEAELKRLRDGRKETKET